LASRTAPWYTVSLVGDTVKRFFIGSTPDRCLSSAADASMFIASFVAGLAIQIPFKEAGKHSVEFAEEWGQMFNLAVFFLFGMIVVRDWSQFTLSSWVYAVLSLTVVRMIPVAVALIGTRLSRPSVLFMGWFGPCGLASIVLGLVYLEQELHLSNEPTIRATVVLSIFAHGLSAMPGISIYARKLAALSPSAPERQEIVT
jgi:NhaP-type Na+/H+ and K+/H+ antiporter